MPVYEVASGSAIAMVEAFCRHLTSAGTFDTTTSPRRTQVTDFINTSGYWVAALLAKNGYSTAQADAEVVGFLQELNVYDSVIKVEMSVPTSDISGEGNARFQEFKARLNQMVEMVEDTDVLERLGATVDRAPSADLLATGVSRDRKDTVYDDTDHIPHRFRRGIHRAPGLINPASSVEGDLSAT